MKRDMITGDSSDILCLPFNSDPKSVRIAIKVVNKALSRVINSADELALIEIALTEVTNNIVEHAYLKMPGQPIDLRVRIHRNKVSFEFVNRGLAMPDGEIPADVPQDFDCPTADLPEGGFGWTLIHRLTSGLEYARVGAENHLRFFFFVRDSAETD